MESIESKEEKEPSTGEIIVAGEVQAWQRRREALKKRIDKLTERLIETSLEIAQCRTDMQLEEDHLKAIVQAAKDLSSGSIPRDDRFEGKKPEPAPRTPQIGEPLTLGPATRRIFGGKKHDNRRIR
jgi:hypothetical protein